MSSCWPTPGEHLTLTFRWNSSRRQQPSYASDLPRSGVLLSTPLPDAPLHTKSRDLTKLVPSDLPNNSLSPTTLFKRPALTPTRVLPAVSSHSNTCPADVDVCSSNGPKYLGSPALTSSKRSQLQPSGRSSAFLTELVSAPFLFIRRKPPKGHWSGTSDV